MDKIENNSPVKINNIIVWILAFAPILGEILRGIILGIMYGGNDFKMMRAIAEGDLWYITLILNIGLSFLDEKILAKSNINTSVFKNWTFIVPVYLYQRAQYLKHNLAYFIVWLVSFFFSMFA